MRIDISFQSLAQKLKYKAISNSLRKRKKWVPPAAHHHAAHMDVAQRETALPMRDPQDTPQGREKI